MITVTPDVFRRKAHALRTFLLCLLLMLTACSSQIPAEPSRAPSDGVESAALLEDIDYMLMMLKHNYPFYNTQTTSFPSTLKDVRERISSGKSTLEQFRGEIDAILACFVVRAHLGTVSPAAYQQYRAAFHESQADHAEYALWNAQLEMPGVRAYYERPGALSDIDPSSAPPAGLVTRVLQEGRTAYAKIQTFDMEASKPDRDALMEFFVENKDSQHLILDLRGNGGGTTAYWLDNILKPLQRSPLLYDTTFLIKDGIVNRYYTAGDALLPAKREWLEAGSTSALQILAQYGASPDLSQEYDWMVRSRYRIDPSIEEYVGFRGKVYVLCDETNYSAAEAFLCMCKMTGFATIVGRTSGGDGIGSGDPMFIALPNTGLLIRYTATYALNPDGTCNQVRGTAPDVEIGEEEDALDVCLDVIAGRR